MHGYELRKRLNLMLGWGRVLSYGSLYPALKKLLKAGMIAEDTGAVPTTASRRQRIVYALTPAGEVLSHLELPPAYLPIYLRALREAGHQVLAVAQDLAYAIKPLTLQMDLSSAMGQFAQGFGPVVSVPNKGNGRKVVLGQFNLIHDRLLCQSNPQTETLRRVSLI